MCTHSSEEMNPKENEWFDKMQELINNAPEETTYMLIARSGSNSCKGRGIITLHGKGPEIMTTLVLSFEKAPDLKAVVEESVSFSNLRKENPLFEFLRK